MMLRLERSDKEALKTPYSTPTRHDMCVILCVFNPTKSQRIRANYVSVIQKLGTAGIPFESVEEETQSVMFYKENLWNIGAHRVISRFEKLCFIDADIIFGCPDWYDQCSTALDQADVVQPFSEAVFLEESEEHYEKKVSSALAAGIGTPGLALAMTSRLFDRVGGFYDRCLVGGGDNVIMSVLKQKQNCVYHNWLGQVVSLIHKPTLDAYLQRVRDADTMSAFIEMRVYHLYYGPRCKRQYTSRYSLTKRAMLKKGLGRKVFDDLIQADERGIYEWNPEVRATMNEIVMKYFLQRDDDGACR